MEWPHSSYIRGTPLPLLFAPSFPFALFLRSPTHRPPKQRPDLFTLPTLSAAWQSQDIAPTSGISIPTDAGLGNGSAMATDDQNWGSNGNGRSPVRDREDRDRGRNGDGPRRSRSRSPGPPREDRGGGGGGGGGSVPFLDLGSILAVHASPREPLYSMIEIARTPATTCTFLA